MNLRPTTLIINLSLYFFVGFGTLKANVLKDTAVSYIPRSLAINFSTRGYGIEAGFKLRNISYLGFRLHANYFGFKKSQKIEMDKGTSLEVFPDISSFVLGGLADYYPFKKRSFRLTGGFSCDVKQNYRVAFSTSSGLDLGGLLISSDDFGNINMGIKWNTFRPYLGLGFGRSIMKKSLGVGFDMGVAYMGSPKLELLYEGFLETTTIDQEIKKVEANMQGYSFYPYLSIQLKYNLFAISKHK